MATKSSHHQRCDFSRIALSNVKFKSAVAGGGLKLAKKKKAKKSGKGC